MAERGDRQGVNPRTRERITIKGGKVPRFTAGSALKQAVKGLAPRPQARQDRCRPPAGELRRPRRELRFASARASCCSGSTRTRPSCCPLRAQAAAGDSPAELAAGAVAAHCRALIDSAGGACVGVKLQLACFERLGAPGARALAQVAAHARAAGLLVVADGKRGDVPHTAAAYAQALLGATETPWGTVPGLGADAVTANPLLGRDSLEPIVTRRPRRGRRRVRARAHLESRRGGDPGRLAGRRAAAA